MTMQWVIDILIVVSLALIAIEFVLLISQRPPRRSRDAETDPR